MPRKKASRAGRKRATPRSRMPSGSKREVAADAHPARSQARKSPAAAAGGGGKSPAEPKRILIIDSDRASIRQARSHLKPEGYEVDSVADPLEGLRRAKGGGIALVLVDIALAEMDGYQVCKSMTTDYRTCHIPVVFLTQRTEPADRLLGFLAGGSDYITKPFTRDTLVQGVNKLLRGGERT